MVTGEIHFQDMPTYKNLKILAIDPGTREMGVALLEGEKLIHYGVKAIKRKRSPHETLKEGRKVVLRLINDYRPDVLVVEKTFFANNRNSSLLNVFVDEIKAIGKRKGLRKCNKITDSFYCFAGRIV